MKLPPEGVVWLVRVRWLVCAAVFLVVWLASSVLGVVTYPMPLYAVAGMLVLYNFVLWWLVRQEGLISSLRPEQLVFWQVAIDLTLLLLLLYFSDFSRNPFLVYFVFHMIIGGMYIRGNTPYVLTSLATVLIGAVMAGEYFGVIPRFPLHFGTADQAELAGLQLLGQFFALASTLWAATYFTVSIRRYVDRAHAELRQKEKMVGIGQLVAGIAHQIANPLDGAQNCVRLIGERVRDDPHLMNYVHLMTDALHRIEQTAKRVQAFSQPKGISLEKTDVNAAIETTLAILGTKVGPNITVKKELNDVPPVWGDPYTLQEVIFNLCTNALAAMPEGGTLTLRSRQLGKHDDDQMDSVAVEVIDTGVGIPRVNLEKIFEPFFTTRADSGGTGLGLGLCRMLITEMGGRIEVRSTLGQGTSFTVVLNPYQEPKQRKR
ncbi:MAG: hypothetical protein D6741_01585 [Planctomycetota bacterium]|nr:MAG: hypothetical protein D6741_01585 [Planctomycetota bacterium]